MLKRCCRTCVNFSPYIFDYNWYDIESPPEYQYRNCYLTENDIDCNEINDCCKYKSIKIEDLME